jgi:phosphate ABC transporter phosphate-binding protein
MSTAVLAEESEMGSFRRLATALVATLIAVGPVTVISAGITASPAAAAGPTLTGTGSSYAAIAIDQWVAQVEAVDGININYATASSVIGLNFYAQNEVDFGASEIGYSTGQAQSAPPAGTYQYLPDVAGAMCLDYNLTGTDGNKVTALKVNSSILTKIFTGQMTSWNDPALKALNPGLPLPSGPIVVVYRTDPSGENYLFSDYLDYEQPSMWSGYTAALGFPDGPTAIWPFPQEGGSSGGGKYNFNGWIGQQGADNASNYVASTSGTITYVEAGYAKEWGDPCAFVQNASGLYQQPSELNDAVALEKAQLLPDLEQKLDGVFANTLPDTYPISAYSYLVVPKLPLGHMAPAKGAELGEFIEYLACDGQQAAGELGYSPLPPNLVQEDFNGIDKIQGAAKAPSSPTPSNCANPYVDGQTPLPGEPTIIGQGGGGGSGGGGGGGGGSGSGGGGSGSGGGGSGSGGGGSGSGGGSGAGSGSGGSGGGGSGSSGSSSGSGSHSSTSSSSGSSGGGGSGGGSTSAVGGTRTIGKGGSSYVIATGGQSGEQIIAGDNAGTALPGGEIIGSDLATAASLLLSSPTPAFRMLAWFGVALLLLAAPPLLISARRRRRRRAPAVPAWDPLGGSTLPPARDGGHR